MTSKDIYERKQKLCFRCHFPKMRLGALQILESIFV